MPNRPHLSRTETLRLIKSLCDHADQPPVTRQPHTEPVVPVRCLRALLELAEYNDDTGAQRDRT